MPDFSYQIVDPQGKTVGGSLHAKDYTEAATLVQKQGVILTLTENAGLADKLSRYWAASSGPSNRELMFFTRELSSLLRGGVPLVRALTLLAKNVKHKGFLRILQDITEKVASGNPLHTAMQAHPEAFPPLYIGLVEAGSASGQLQPILRHLAEHLKATQKMRDRLRAAMTYPAIVLVICFGVLIFFSLKIVPPFAAIFKSFNMKLPLLTQIIVDASDFMINRVWELVFVFSGLILAGKSYLLSKMGKRQVSWAQLNVPVVRELFENAFLERFLSIFSLLLESGVSMLRALDLLTGAMSDNPIYCEALASASKRVAQGETLAASLSKSGVFPPLVIGNVETGEESGQLTVNMAGLAEYYQEKTETALEAFTTVLEPVLTVVMGAVVGMILFSLFLPMVQLSSLKPQ